MPPQKVMLVLVALLLLAGAASLNAQTPAPQLVDPFPLPVWQHETVAEEVGPASALALDSSGAPQVLYFKSAESNLYWARLTPGGWQHELVTAVSATDLDVALAVDVSGEPHIAYVDGAADKLVYGRRQAGLWTLTPVSAGGSDLSLALGSDGAPQIILVQGDDLRYWWLDDQNWRSEIAGTKEIGLWNPRLALDSDDHPQVAYSPGGPDSIYSARQGPDVWPPQTVPYELVQDLQSDPDGFPYLLHTETKIEFPDGRIPDTTYLLGVSVKEASGWLNEPVMEHVFDYDRPRLGIGPDGGLHIIYRDELRRFVYLQRRGPDDWLWERPAPPGDGDADLAIAPDGMPLLLSHSEGGLILSRRVTLLLGHHALLPLIGRNE